MPYLIENQTMYMSDESSRLFIRLVHDTEFRLCTCLAIRIESAAYKVHYNKYFDIRRVLLKQVPSCLRVA